MMLMALFSAPCGIKIDYNNNHGYNFSSNNINSSCITAGHLYPTNLIPSANSKRLRSCRSLTSIPQTTRSYRRFNHTRAETAETMATTEKLGIKIVHNPPESKLAELGVRSWSKWGCPPSKFPWTYSSKETCYLLKGKVKVYPDPDKFDEAVEIGAGDLVVFPKGMSCTWDVSEAVDKHYMFE